MLYALAIFFTSEVCTVSPFLDAYEAKKDVPICSAATAVDLDTGETIILEAGQGLYFEDEMERSSINPNQLRVFWIPACDDPTDKHRSLCIDLGEFMCQCVWMELSVPFPAVGFQD